MNKRKALFLSVVITLVIAGNWLFFNASIIFPDREIVIVARVIDGDTIELKDGRTIRLLNINTPERGEFGAELAKEYLLAFENKSVEFEYAGVEKYGRILGRIFDESYLNLELVKLGYAHPFLVDDREIEIFKDAERKAFEKNEGIWKRSEYYGCIEAEIDEKEEKVEISDKCDINFENWIIKDESTKRYKFSSFRANRFTLYSGEGENGENELFWGAGNIWNNDQDSIFIRDDKGFLVYFDSYGY